MGRYEKVRDLVMQLPEANRRALKILTFHLNKVVQKQHLNKMSLMNVGVCFGPTLLREKLAEETMSSIMEIKFSNIIVEILIENCMDLFSRGEFPNEGSSGTLRKLKPAFVRLPSQRIKKRTQRPRLHNWQALSEALHQETRDSPKAKKSPYEKKKISPDPIQMSVDDWSARGESFRGPGPSGIWTGSCGPPSSIETRKVKQVPPLQCLRRKISMILISLVTSTPKLTSILTTSTNLPMKIEFQTYHPMSMKLPTNHPIRLQLP